MSAIQPVPEYAMALANVALLVLWIVAVIGARKKWRVALTIFGAFLVGCLVGSITGMLLAHSADALAPAFGWVGGFVQTLFEINHNLRAKRIRQERDANRP